MLGILRQRRWLGFTAFVLAMLVLCVILARWQWNRYQYRLGENDRLDAALSAPAIPVDELLDAEPAGADAPALPQELEWRTVTATGTFDAAARDCCPAPSARRAQRVLDRHAAGDRVRRPAGQSGLDACRRDATTAPDVPRATRRPGDRHRTPATG